MLEHSSPVKSAAGNVPLVMFDAFVVSVVALAAKDVPPVLATVTAPPVAIVASPDICTVMV